MYLTISRVYRPFAFGFSLLLVITIVQRIALGQVGAVGDTTSTPVAGLGHSYIKDLNEIVDPKDGSLSIRIASPLPQERGVSLPVYPFNYNSNNQPTPTPVWASGTASQGRQYVTNVYLQSPLTLGRNNSVTFISGTINGVEAGQPVSCLVTNNFVYTDPSGGRHSLSGLQSASQPSNNGCQGMGYLSSAANQTVGDASYVGIISAAGYVTVYDTHGNKMASSQDSQPNSSVEDTNGNYLRPSGRTYTQSGGTVTIPGVGGSYTSSGSFQRTGTTVPYPFHVQPFSTNDTDCTKTFTATAGGYTGTSYLTLPNGQQYSFGIDSTFGLINHVSYPTGVTVDYTWTSISQSQEELASLPTAESCKYFYDWPSVTDRLVKINGNPIEEQVFSYQVNWSATGEPRTTTITTKDLATTGAPSYKTVYVTYDHMLQSNPPDSISTYDTKGNLLSTTYKVWSSSNQLLAECMTPSGANVTKGIFHTYGGPGDVMEVETAEYDYGLVSPSCVRPTSGSATRDTKTVYQTFSSAPMIFDRPQSVKVYGNGALLSETDYTYDEYSSYPLVSITNVTGHDEQNFSASGTISRGNPTTVTHKCFVGSTACVDYVNHFVYDETGMVQKESAGSSTTSFSYLDSYTADSGSPTGQTNTYLTTITHPATNGVSHVENFTYGFKDGKMRTAVDENSKTTKYCYWTGGCSGTTFDPWLRLTQTQLPDGGGSTNSYNDAAPSASVTTTTLASPNPSIVTESIYDAMGRLVTNEITSAGTIETDRSYNGVGQVASISNPYVPGDTKVQTTFTYDSLGRKTIQAQPDGALQQWCYNGISSNSQTNCAARDTTQTNTTWVDISDESGNRSENDYDGLGRLVTVVEPNPTLAAFGNVTNYTYDALGNLVGSLQHGLSTEMARSRSFTYDSLSRLLSATNPESGTICYGPLSGTTCGYGYDANGNLLYKTDAHGVTIGYSYDGLNRLVSKTYFNDPSGTASSCFQYDTSSLVTGTSGLLIGRTTNTWTQKGSCPAATSPPSFTSNPAILSRHSFLAYDAMGRVKNEQQCTKANCGTSTSYIPAYTYDLAGNLLTHSSGIASGPFALTFTNGYDSAGQLCSVLSGATRLFATPQYVAGSGCAAVNSSLPGYSPAGGLMNATFGIGLQLSRTYDSRLRIASESDTGNAASNPTPGTATITISGSDQPH